MGESRSLFRVRQLFHIAQVYCFFVQGEGIPAEGFDLGGLSVSAPSVPSAGTKPAGGTDDISDIL